MISFEKICLKSQINKWNLLVEKLNKKNSISLSLCPNFGIILSEIFNMQTEYFLVKENKTEIGVFVGLSKKNKFYSMPLLTNGGVFLFNDNGNNIKEIYNIFFSERNYNYRVKTQIRFSKFSVLNKITVYKDLPETEDLLISSFKSKLRSQIKKAYKNDLSVKINDSDCLINFYKIYAKGLHRLGTPVPGISFFKRFKDNYPKERLTFFTVYYNGEPIGTSICFAFYNYFEVMWASTIFEHNKLNTNMILYYEMMKFAIKSKNKIFSFGRSNLNSGSLRFKKQWDVKEIPIYDNYATHNTNLSKYKFLNKIWVLLPFKLTLFLGPILRKYIIN